MDDRPNRRNKARFSSFFDVVRTGLEALEEYITIFLSLSGVIFIL